MMEEHHEPPVLEGAATTNTTTTTTTTATVTHHAATTTVTTATASDAKVAAAAAAAAAASAAAPASHQPGASQFAPATADETALAERTHPPSDSDTPNDVIDPLSTLKAVNAGLWGLWSSVASSAVVKDVVSHAKAVTDSAAKAVQEKGIVQSAKDGAQAAVEATKQADARFLNGTLTKIVDKTLHVAEKGVEAVMDLNKPAKTPTDVRFIITTPSFSKVNALRGALEQTFPDAGLRAMQSKSNIAVQPVGAAAAKKGALERIAGIKAVPGSFKDSEVFISAESFISNPFGDVWMEHIYVILQDSANEIELETIGQGISVPASAVKQAKEATTEGYQFKETGLEATISSIVGKDADKFDLYSSVCGLSTQSIIHVAFVVILGQYRHTLAQTAAATKALERS